MKYSQLESMAHPTEASKSWFVVQVENDCQLEGYGSPRLKEGGWYLVHRVGTDWVDHDSGTTTQEGLTEFTKLSPFVEKLLDDAYNDGIDDTKRKFREFIK